MAIKTINVGTKANTGAGDPLRDAMIKINENFSELSSDVVTLKQVTGVDAATGNTLVVNAIQGDVIGQDSSVIVNASTNTFNGDLTGSVFADDSTLLVDGVAGTINAGALTGALPAIDGSALTGITAGVASSLDGDMTGSVFADDSTLLIDGVAGTINSSALTKPIKLNDSEKIHFGTDDDLQVWHTGADGIIQNATGQLQLRGNTVRLLNAATTKDYAYFNNNGSVDLYYDNVKTFATSAAGIQIEQGVEEKFATLTGSTGVVAHDCDNGHVFYHTGSSGDITANFTNLDLTAEYATNVTIIIDQGGTPYEVTAVQIGGAAQTIVWQGNNAPTGTANGVDSFSFTILNDGGTYVVLGQMVAFGGV